MNIDSIKNGIVIDHISAGNSLKLYQLLKLDELDCSVAIIKNVASKKTGKKDIIKIDADIDIDLDILGYVDPDVTINIIKDSKLVEKKKIDLPESLSNVIFCKNPRCITSCENEIEHIFKLADKENRVYRCVYCETKAEM
jgi:aspartate carbamoyltransferase regulatory subunit